MEFTRTGSYHSKNNINNQDAFLVKGKLKAIFDGCSGGKNSEVGAKLFSQIFAMQNDFDKVSAFEENVKKTFEKMLYVCGFKSKEDVTEEMVKFIFDNFCFTMFFCFEEAEGFVVKYLGDGTVITCNKEKQISYITLRYGSAPPYYIYNYIPDKFKSDFFDPLSFKTLRFPKEDFENVGVSSDGIFPIVRGSENIDPDTKKKYDTDDFEFAEKVEFDSFLKLGVIEANQLNKLSHFLELNAKTGIFSDDITICF